MFQTIHGYDKMYFLQPHMVKHGDNDNMIGLYPNTQYVHYAVCKLLEYNI
jgi:hypothetical protein